MAQDALTHYFLPKGRCEPGENLQCAARREIKEEAGISDLTYVEKLGVYERLNYTKKSWKVIHYFLFQTEQIEGVPTDTKHAYSCEWFPLDALATILWPEQIEVMEKLRHQIFKSIRYLQKFSVMLSLKSKPPKKGGVEGERPSTRLLFGGFPVTFSVVFLNIYYLTMPREIMEDPQPPDLILVDKLKRTPPVFGRSTSAITGGSTSITWPGPGTSRTPRPHLGDLSGRPGQPRRYSGLDGVSHRERSELSFRRLAVWDCPPQTGRFLP